MGQPAMLRDPELRRLRAMQMVERRLHNVSMTDVAKEFNVAVGTVERELKWIKEQDLFESFEDQIRSELIPQAIATFKKAMENGDVSVAAKVFKGTGLLLKPSEKVAAQAAQTEASDTLEVYLKRTLKGGADAANRLNAHPSGALTPTRTSGADSRGLLEGSPEHPETIEAELVEGGDEGGSKDAQ